MATETATPSDELKSHLRMLNFDKQQQAETETEASANADADAVAEAATVARGWLVKL